jgi:predicted ribosome-associated RNA-binding protein Tma20
MRPHGSSGRDRMTEGIKKKKKKVPEGTYIVTVQRQIGRYIFRSRILQ